MASGFDQGIERILKIHRLQRRGEGAVGGVPDGAGQRPDPLLPQKQQRARRNRQPPRLLCNQPDNLLQIHTARNGLLHLEHGAHLIGAHARVPCQTGVLKLNRRLMGKRRSENPILRVKMAGLVMRHHDHPQHPATQHHGQKHPASGDGPGPVQKLGQLFAHRLVPRSLRQKVRYGVGLTPAQKRGAKRQRGMLQGMPPDKIAQRPFRAICTSRFPCTR